MEPARRVSIDADTAEDTAQTCQAGDGRREGLPSEREMGHELGEPPMGGREMGETGNEGDGRLGREPRSRLIDDLRVDARHRLGADHGDDAMGAPDRYRGADATGATGDHHDTDATGEPDDYHGPDATGAPQDYHGTDATGDPDAYRGPDATGGDTAPRPPEEVLPGETGQDSNEPPMNAR